MVGLMTHDEVKYWAVRMQKAAAGHKDARRQVNTMEKILSYTKQKSLRVEISEAYHQGLLKGLLDGGLVE